MASTASGSAMVTCTWSAVPGAVEIGLRLLEGHVEADEVNVVAPDLEDVGHVVGP